MEAANEVNDEAALDTPIDANDAPTVDLSRADSEDSPTIAKSGSGSTILTEGKNKRELIWKTAEGTEKRLMLPIEIIQEDIMDDPERLLQGVSDQEVSKEERTKLVSAL